MKTQRNLAVPPGEQRPLSPVKPEPAVAALLEARVPRRRSSGWDPYEVWRTRVKADQDPQDEAEANPAA